VISAAGWLAEARRLDSPNVDLRPPGDAISLLIIHNISLPPGSFGGGHVAELFTNTLDPGRHPYFATLAGLQVSAHLLIDRDGLVTQFAPFTQRTWHAGASCYGGRSRCNDFAIGIELEGTDIDPYTPAQYQALTAITRELMAAYPEITPERIVGHEDVAPGRKTDPGCSFDWHRYLTSLRQTQP